MYPTSPDDSALVAAENQQDSANPYRHHNSPIPATPIIAIILILLAIYLLLK